MSCPNLIKLINIKSPLEVKDSPDGTIFELLHVGPEWGDYWGKKVQAIKCQDKLIYFIDFINIDELNEKDYEILVAETKTFPQYK